MEEKIKNFIEEGKKEFEDRFPDYELDAESQGHETIRKNLKQFISSRQISLIKMIVEEIKDINVHEFNTREELIDTISSKLKELIKE